MQVMARAGIYEIYTLWGELRNRKPNSYYRKVTMRGTIAPACLLNPGLVTPTVSSPISSVTPAVKTASAALFSGTRFVDGEIAAVEVRAVKRIDGVLRLFG